MECKRVGLAPIADGASFYSTPKISRNARTSLFRSRWDRINDIPLLRIFFAVRGYRMCKIVFEICHMLSTSPAGEAGVYTFKQRLPATTIRQKESQEGLLGPRGLKIVILDRGFSGFSGFFAVFLCSYEVAATFQVHSNLLAQVLFDRRSPTEHTLIQNQNEPETREPWCYFADGTVSIISHQTGYLFALLGYRIYKITAETSNMLSTNTAGIYIFE